jgi:predicted nucleic acid-binding protein
LNYIDTSVLVAALTTEPHTLRAERLLTSGRAGGLAISEWVVAEFSSALSLKLRLGTIDLEARRAGLEALGTMIEQSLVLLPVTSAHFRTAARFADQHQLGLRAPDALHLAVAADHGAMLCTLDKRLAGAGKALGVASKLV